MHDIATGLFRVCFGIADLCVTGAGILVDMVMSTNFRPPRGALLRVIM